MTLPISVVVGRGTRSIRTDRREARKDATLPTISDLREQQEEHRELLIQYQTVRVELGTLKQAFRKLTCENEHLTYVNRMLTEKNEQLEENSTATKELRKKPQGKLKRFQKNEVKKPLVLTVRLSAELKKRIDDAAWERRESLNHLAVRALEEFLAR